MKQARGAAGLPGATQEDDFKVVPVESTSEYRAHLDSSHLYTLNSTF